MPPPHALDKNEQTATGYRRHRVSVTHGHASLPTNLKPMCHLWYYDLVFMVWYSRRFTPPALWPALLIFTPPGSFKAVSQSLSLPPSTILAIWGWWVMGICLCAVYMAQAFHPSVASAHPIIRHASISHHLVTPAYSTPHLPLGLNYSKGTICVIKHPDVRSLGPTFSISAAGKDQRFRNTLVSAKPFLCDTEDTFRRSRLERNPTGWTDFFIWQHP